MANKKISELTALLTASAGDVLPIVALADSTTYLIAVSDLTKNVNSASFATTASFTMNCISASYFSGSISDAVFATSASYATHSFNATSASHALVSNLTTTASHALVSDTAISAQTASMYLGYTTDFVSQSSWIVNHNLGTRRVAVTVYDSSYLQVIPQAVELQTENIAIVTLGQSTSGFVVVK